MNTIIVSPGGVGTTFIMQYFSRYLHVNCVHDSDGLKHVNNPLILSKFKNVRVLVIIGKPSEIALSLSRRNILIEQIIKLNKRSFRRILLKIIGVNRYLKFIEDPLSYQKFLLNWIHGAGSERLIVKYESIYKYEAEIKEFLLGKNQHNEDAFPPKRERTVSDNINYREIIKKKYHSLDMYYSSLNDLIQVDYTDPSKTRILIRRTGNILFAALKKIF